MVLKSTRTGLTGEEPPKEKPLEHQTNQRKKLALSEHCGQTTSFGRRTEQSQRGRRKRVASYTPSSLLSQLNENSVSTPIEGVKVVYD